MEAERSGQENLQDLSPSTGKVPLHIEAIVHLCCPTPIPTIREEIQRVVSTSNILYENGPLVDAMSSPLIQSCCLSVNVVDLEEDFSSDVERDTFKNGIPFWKVSEVHIHVFFISNDETEMEDITGGGTDNEDDLDTDLAACEVLTLPHQSLQGSWENIVVHPREIKSNLLEYARSALLFSDKNVSDKLITWNRLILLHGPPGGGKTTLSRALAHKLAIRMSHRFDHSCLIEIRSHSLFSKWFSESGKLVARLFTRIKEMLEDDDRCLIFVLIDEVESLAAIRSNESGGRAGSDAVRAVNSLLTGIDRLKKYKNVMLLTTTNITGCIDAAFLDRVDINQYIGYPSVEARYDILRSCLNELLRVEIVLSPLEEETHIVNGTNSDAGKIFQLPSYRHFRASVRRGDNEDFVMATSESGVGLDIDMEYDGRENAVPAESTRTVSTQDYTRMLLRCAEKAVNLSGRTLRKLPFQSHAVFVQREDSVLLADFLVALENGVERELESRAKVAEVDGVT